MLTCAGFSDSAVLQHYLEERIKERAKKHGEFIFGAHRPTTLDIITETWRRRLNALWELCGPWKSSLHRTASAISSPGSSCSVEFLSGMLPTYWGIQSRWFAGITLQDD